MKRNEIYQAWKKQRTQVEISKSFGDDIMNRIRQYKRERRKPLVDVYGLIELISAHPLAKAGAVTAGAVIGLVRITFVVYAFLWC